MLEAKDVRRQATVWLASKVGKLLVAGAPQRFPDPQPLWRMPVLLTSSRTGVVGEVGMIEVDAITGQLLVTDQTKDGLLASVERLTSPVKNLA